MDYLINLENLNEGLEKIKGILGLTSLRVRRRNKSKRARITPSELDGRVRREIEEVDRSDYQLIADLDASLRVSSTGQKWIRTRRPELYSPIAVSTGREEETRVVRFEDDQP